MKMKIKPLFFAKTIICRFGPMVAWISIISLIFWETYNNFHTQPQYFYLRKILGVWLCISRGAAPVITFCSLGAILAACRQFQTIIHRPLSKISTIILAQILSRITYAHTICATTLIIFSVIHSGAHIMNAINFSRHYFYLYPDINVAKYKGENPAYLICTWTGVSGIAMLIILMIMAYTSTRKFRKKHYNYFYLIHHLFIIYLLLLITHPLRGVLKEQYNLNEHLPGCIISNRTNHEENIMNEKEFCKNPPQFKCISTKNWVWIAFGLVIYLLELLSRKYMNNKYKAIEFCIVPGKAVHIKIKVAKNFKIKPGQYILLQCDKISNIEWHPFTVTQCPSKQQENFEVLISVRGDWTKKLYNLGLNPYSFNESTNYIIKQDISPLTFSVNGPFTSPMESIKNNKIAICIAAGVGITAYIATLKKLMNDNISTKIHLLWLTRDPQQILWYSKLLSEILRQLWLQNRPDKLVVKFHVTKETNMQLNYLFDDLILSRIYKGRPNWKEEFSLWNKLYKKSNITIYCCGPNNLRRVLNKYCNKMKNKGNHFNFIYEGF